MPTPSAGTQHHWRTHSPRSRLTARTGAALLGGAVLFWTFAQSTIDSFQKPGTEWFGVGSSWVMGMILLAVGIPSMLRTASRDSSFFQMRHRSDRPAARPRRQRAGTTADGAGDQRDVIASIAEEVLGRANALAHSAGLRGALLGATTNRLLNQTERPVLVVPATE